MSIQLFCIPYAGGRAEVFHQLRPYLREDIELVCVDFAGHGERAKEPFYVSFDEMARDVASKINDRITAEKIAVFGYSMGSVVTFEMLLNGYLAKKPECFFLASHEAPGEHWASMDYAELDDEAFFKKLVAFGSFKTEDEGRLNNRFFRKLIFEPIKVDYNFIAGYRLSKPDLLDVKAVMMYAPDDVPPKLARKWQNRFATEIEFIEMGTNHFFINDIPEAVADVINKRCR